jgi:hypothetical protein
MKKYFFVSYTLVWILLSGLIVMIKVSVERGVDFHASIESYNLNTVQKYKIDRRGHDSFTN